MFDDYIEKIQNLTDNAPKVIHQVAIKGANNAETKAVNLTSEEQLVDTVNYKRNWIGKAVKVGEDEGIKLTNVVEYASYLEYGHKLRNGKRWKGRFVGDRSLQDTAYYCLVEFDKAWQKLVSKKGKI